MRERSNEVHALIAGQRAHGAAGIFYTCAPDDVHQPASVRRSFRVRAANPIASDLTFDHLAENVRTSLSAKECRYVFPKAKEDAFDSALRGQTPEERVTASDF